MVYPQEHILLRFNGHFGTSSSVLDRWSSTIRMGLVSSAPAYDPAKLQTLVNAAQTAGIAFHTAANVNAGTSAYFDQVAGAQVGVSGRYLPSGQLTVLSPNTPTAGLVTTSLPFTSASVLSLRTAIPRGRGSNGRVYWPCTSMPIIGGTGRINTLARNTAAKTFLDALNVAGNTYSAGMRVIVASNVGAGLHAIVTAVRSDDRLDNIEARENDQPVLWSTAALA